MIAVSDHATADRFYVDASAPPGGSGESWNSPYKFLEQALVASQLSTGDDEIWVRQNIYTPNSSEPAGAFYWVRPGTQLYGGFAGGEQFRTQRDPVARPTILDGLLLPACPPAGALGGDCFEESSGPGCKDWTCCGLVCLGFPDCCEIAWDELCVEWAKEVCTAWPPPVDSAIRLVLVNEAQGAFESRRLDGFTVRHGSLTNGVDPESFAQAGGGVLVSAGEIEIVRCTFTLNRAHRGGAVAVTTEDSGTTIRNCRFEANAAVAQGGAVLVAGPVVIANSIFAGQDLEQDNGQSSTFTYGGAIVDDVGSDGVMRSITNCTFAGNKATVGGGVAASPLSDYADDLLVHNCIVWGNATETDDPSEIGPGLTVKYSNVRGGYGGSGDHNIDVDPQYASTVPGSIDLLSLELGSDCIDAGSNLLAVIDDIDVDDDEDDGELGPDLLLRRRDQPAPGSSAAVVDMGAYEYPNCTCSLADLNDDDAVDGADLGLLLSVWGPCPSTGDCPADLNSDGVVDGADLGLLLAGWCGELFYPRDCGEFAALSGGGESEGAEGLSLADLAGIFGYLNIAQFVDWLSTLPFGELEFILELLDD